MATFSIFCGGLVVFFVSSTHSQRQLTTNDPIEDMPTYYTEAKSEKQKGKIWTNMSLQRDIMNLFEKDSASRRPNIEKKIFTTGTPSYSQVPPNALFYDTNPVHLKAVKEFKEMLLEKKTVGNIISEAGRWKGTLHRKLWLNGFLEAILNCEHGSHDAVSTYLPIVEILPDKFLPGYMLEAATREAEKPLSSRTCVVVDSERGTSNGIENVLWYFREDVMVNSHHWYWHLEYPVNDPEPKDRKGELFYYMHHSFLARYHAERLSNDLPPVVPLQIKRGARLKEAYNPLLFDIDSSRTWANRQSNLRFNDITDPGLPGVALIQIDDFVTFEKRLQAAADSGLFLQNDSLSTISLKDFAGIDIFGHAAEATVLSRNSAHYGVFGYHNSGHALIGFIHEPFAGQRLPGVMSDTATSMRDIAFFRWHTTINNLFKSHKDTLPPYEIEGGQLPLRWEGVRLVKVQVQTIRKTSPRNNVLYTFWGTRRYDLTLGLDLLRNASAGNTPVYACVDHLTHDDFTYTFQIIRRPFVQSSMATVRIFMAPRFNENGGRYSMEEQRSLFFVLDTFSVSLKVGRNIITRESTQSELTLEYSKNFRGSLQEDFKSQPQCGCGWPHNMLLPKGKASGMVFDLFVMVTNGVEDFVAQPSRTETCQQGYLYCSLWGRDAKYPDAKPMGYPFDRKVFDIVDFRWGNVVRRQVGNLEEYISQIPNANSLQVNIVHQPTRKEFFQTGR